MVVSDLKTKMNRIKLRDDLTDQDVLKRINSQMSDAEKIPLADYIIENNENCSLLPQVIKIHEDLISKSG